MCWYQTNDGMTLIHLAAKAGQTNVIRYLLENRRLDVNVKVSLQPFSLQYNFDTFYTVLE